MLTASTATNPRLQVSFGELIQLGTISTRDPVLYQTLVVMGKNTRMPNFCQSAKLTFSNRLQMYCFVLVGVCVESTHFNPEKKRVEISISGWCGL